MQPAEYETMFRVETTHWWYRALHDLIFRSLDELLPGWADADILDAGCGTGAILQRLGNADRHLGVDLSTHAIDFCRKRGLRNVHQQDICALPMAEGSFDAVICSSVLYHQWVPDVDRALAELKRVLRPNGLLLLNLPACPFLHSPHDRAVMTARRFRRREVDALLKRHGFAMERNDYWTSLLFPAAFMARCLRLSRTGRDFGPSSPGGTREQFLHNLMRLELALMRTISFPIGVALFSVGRKQ